MQLELAQLASREGETTWNLDRALDVLERADSNTELVIFPETHLTGFAESGHVRDRAIDCNGPEITQIVQSSRENNVAVAIGFLERRQDHVRNTTVLITPERRLALAYAKTHLWTNERELIRPGDRMLCCDWRGHRIGLMICYDIEFPEPARALAMMGADLIAVTNGNMDPYGPVHRRAAAARAQENQIFLAMSNRVGEGADETFAGESGLFDPTGKQLVGCEREETVALAHVDFNAIETVRRDYDYRADRRIGFVGRLEETNQQRAWYFGQ